MNGAPQRRDERRSLHSKLGAMVQGQLAQYFFTFGSQREQYLAPVIASPVPPHQAACGKPVHQFHGAVMLGLQPLGQFSDAWTRACGKPFDSQHQLVLSRFEACLAGSLLAEVKEAMDLVA